MAQVVGGGHLRQEALLVPLRQYNRGSTGASTGRQGSTGAGSTRLNVWTTQTCDGTQGRSRLVRDSCASYLCCAMCAMLSMSTACRDCQHPAY
jgi:hypothetical protein